MFSQIPMYAFVSLMLLVGSTDAKSTSDSPPKLIEFSPATIGDSASYTQIAKNNFEKNVLSCVADNADDIQWQHKQEKSGTWGAIPTAMKLTPPDTNALQLTSKLEDNPSDLQRYEINGYYQCIVTNNKGYKTISPPIRLVYPRLEQVSSLVNPEKMTGVEGQPSSLPCFNDELYKIVPDDYTTLPGAKIAFNWKIRNYARGSLLDVNFESLPNKNRLRVEPRTGELYFAYLKTDDKLGEGETYYCDVILGDANSPVNTNLLQLTVTASDQPILVSGISYPDEAAEKNIECYERQECQLPCIFSGSSAVTGSVAFERPQTSTVLETIQDYGISFTATKDEEGGWKCKLMDASNVVKQSIDLQVTIKKYPKLMSSDQFTSSFSETGSDVKYVCDVENVLRSKIKFYINGVQVTQGFANHVQYDVGRPTEMTIKNLQRNYTASIVCTAENDIGFLYESVDLVVYDKPVIARSPDQIAVQKGNNTQKSFIFNCSFVLDDRTDSSSVKLKWVANNSQGISEDVNDKGDASKGVTRVETIPYSTSSRTVSSQLQIELDSDSDKYLTNSEWHCVVNYKVLSTDVPEAQSPSTLFFISVPPKEVVRRPPFAYTWVIVGVIAGVLFLILLIVLINCYVQKNKGEQYYVDEKERKAGHNPEEEMKAYEFQDYKRPDQNPIKGSRASMNFSDKPMESDTGSIDEYGDIDTGRFNEDGSFIGKYGHGQPRNQADV